MKTGIISQARMTSTRLPGKVLLEAGGKSLLQHHVERLRQSGFPVFIATTVNDTDDAIVAWARANDISVHRGDEQDVLSRFYNLAVAEKLDVIVRVTSDCPLIDGKLLGENIELFLEANNPNLYICNGFKGFPHGFNFEIFSFEQLEAAQENANSAEDREHVTSYIWKNKGVPVTKLLLDLPKNKSHLRVTVDTPEDYDLVRQLIENYHATTLSHTKIIALLDQHPELVAINASVAHRKMW